MECCYTNQIALNGDNVVAVVDVASFLQMVELVDICTRYYRNIMQTSNCLAAWMIAEKYGLDDLKSFASTFIYRYIGKVVKCEEFMHLNSAHLCEILKSDELKIDGEERVFSIIMQWIRHDKEERKGLFETLVRHVRLQHISTSVRSILIDPCPLQY